MADTHLGWDPSAQAWIDSMGENGDPTRRYVLDTPMLSALPSAGHVLDIGCGEGRFCRMMQAKGLQTTGLDLTEAMIGEARRRDPNGAYVLGSGEALPFEDQSFDSAVFYLSLIDIPDMPAAISEAARVLRAGAPLLIANLTSHVTARPRGWQGEGGHWVRDDDGKLLHTAIDDMQKERANIVSWAGIRMENYHRPLSAYMTALLDAGLVLEQFADPPFTGPAGETQDKFDRVPWAFMMVWRKPG